MKTETITWRDSTLYIEEEQKDNKWEVTTITSVGFLIQETDDFVVLAGDDMGDSCRRSIVIPKENIVKRG